MQKYYDALRQLPPPDLQTDWDRSGEGVPVYSVDAVHRIVASLTAPETAPADSYRAAFYADAAKDFEG